MEKQLEDKESGTTKITSQMKESMEGQEEDLKKQIGVYIEEADKKKLEEAELQKVLDDYKARFVEFEKSIKLSKKTLGQYEKEIMSMNRKINLLKEQKHGALKEAEQ